MAGLSPAAAHLQAAASAAELLELDDSMTAGAGVSTACGWLWWAVAAEVGAGCDILWPAVAADCCPYNPLVNTGSTESFDVAGFA